MVDRTSTLNSDATALTYTPSKLQQSYWLGEKLLESLNCPGVLHKTYELNDLDPVQLEEAFQEIVSKNAALRANFVAADKISFEQEEQITFVDFFDLTSVPDIQLPNALDACREESKMRFSSSRKFNAVKCTAIKTREQSLILFHFALAVFDGHSLDVFLRKLTRAYVSSLTDERVDRRYMEYLEAEHRQSFTDDYEDALNFWTEKYSDGLNGPDLPKSKSRAISWPYAFRRNEIRLKTPEISRLYALASEFGVTVNVLILSLYVDALRRYSNQNAFQIVALVSKRSFGTSDLSDTIGNCASTLIIDTGVPGERLSARVKELQKELYQAMAFSHASGIDVARSLGSTHPITVVFSGSLPLRPPQKTSCNYSMDLRCIESEMHTPQVTLDHQAYVEGEEVVLSIDHVPDAYPANFIENFTLFYKNLISALLKNGDYGDSQVIPLPEGELRDRQKANQTERPVNSRTLLEPVFRSFDAHHEKVALIIGDKAITYSELQTLVIRRANALCNQGVKNRAVVAISLERGEEEIVNCLAIQMLGATYLPLSHTLPDSRKDHVLRESGAVLLVTDRPLLGKTKSCSEYIQLPVDCIPPAPSGFDFRQVTKPPVGSDLAYIIYTSGSTGQPKGVAIEHQAVCNTIEDINRRLEIDETDRGILISALNFDLSVYDIFGLLAVGGSIVIPKHSINPTPTAWARLVDRHEVTVWNSVPAIMELCLASIQHESNITLQSLRRILLSGDWIPPFLASRILDAIPTARLVALGGATEASIWSNYHWVNSVDPSAASIPYGLPLANQRFHVLNGSLGDAPTWTEGDLYIAGNGLAKNYHNDITKTEAAFLNHPITGERLYKTGDLGRYLSDGVLEFLGRRDRQVKINGFRVELGEIDAIIEEIEDVGSCVSTVRKDSSGRSMIVVFLRLEKGANADNAAHVVKVVSRENLPGYMVPHHVEIIPEIPLSTNGKVDTKALTKLPLSLASNFMEVSDEITETETRLLGIWHEVLGREISSLHESFFECGGSSLIAVSLLNAIAREWDVALSFDSLYQYSTISTQANRIEAIQSKGTGSDSLLNTVRDPEGAKDVVILVHPVGGTTLCYTDLVSQLPNNVSVHTMASPGDGCQRTVTSLATFYVELIEKVSAGKGIHLMGWSMGGVIAQEIARIFAENNCAVATLTMIDSHMPAPDTTPKDVLRRDLEKLFVESIAGAEHPDLNAETIDSLRQDNQLVKSFEEFRANYLALIDHQPRLVSCPTLVFTASLKGNVSFPCLIQQNTSAFTENNIIEESLVATHFSIIKRPIVDIVVKTLRPLLRYQSRTRNHENREKHDPSRFLQLDSH